MKNIKQIAILFLISLMLFSCKSEREKKEEYFEEETFRKKTKPRAKKLTTEKAVVVKISDKVRKDMEVQGFNFKEGDVVFTNIPKGFYILKALVDSQTITKKVIIE